MTAVVRRMAAFAFASASGLLQTHPLRRGTLNNFLHCSSVLSCRRSSFSDVRDRNMSYRDRLRCGVHDCHAEYAVDLFDQMVQSRPVPSIVDFTKLLSAIMKMKRYDVVISLCKKMELLGVSHDIYSLNVLINCFSHSPQVFLGLSVVGKILKLGYKPNVVTYNILAHGFCIHGKISAALSLVDQMVEEGYKPNVVTFSTLINGFCIEGRVSEALSLLDQMLKMDCEPNVVTFAIVINGACKARDYALAMNLLEKMEEMHIEIDIVIYNTIIDYLCKAGHVEGALNLFGKMDSCGIVPDVVTFSSMINGYCKANRVDQGLNLFYEMSRRGLVADAITYNILIQGFYRVGNLGAAQKFFMEMQYKGHRPDLVTYIILLDGLCKNGKTDKALCLYNKLGKSVIDLDIPLHSCMMHVTEISASKTEKKQNGWDRAKRMDKLIEQARAMILGCSKCFGVRTLLPLELRSTLKHDFRCLFMTNHSPLVGKKIKGEKACGLCLICYKKKNCACGAPKEVRISDPASSMSERNQSLLQEEELRLWCAERGQNL
ncbi:PREDICTED: pentatricopeptide repeat-containing protein At1g12300, mitochondrial-like [Tarenaya hassleriana]|uniref:pentatricopeptide repeat-containing protein At1g12300, mitochondrial-like n=1 Tax=Tarenaya hassleriana TaxID=28532 RepID=UPI0008FD4104|nr:PREDICTED: pentatricopeptide repeat-containing protein At1g12300, mitochondrial-like [Tarenaya hassleriana]